MAFHVYNEDVLKKKYLAIYNCILITYIIKNYFDHKGQVELKKPK